MPEGDQDQSGVAVGIAPVPSRLDQLLDFLRRQIFAGPQLGIGRTIRN